MTLPAFLKFGAVLYAAVGLLHFVLGAGAERLLDASLPDSVRDLSALDSQSRFYGTYFGMTGSLLWLGARDLRRHKTMLLILFAALFAGGVSRLVSIYALGLPSPLILALLATELVLPPLLWLWLNTAVRVSQNAS